MKRWSKLAAVGLLLIVLWAAYSERLAISSLIWHWKNGTSTRIGSYQVPVPHSWLPRDTPTGLLLLNTRSTSRRHATIYVNILPTNTQNLELWRVSTEKFLRDRGLVKMEEQTLRIAGDTVLCIGGEGEIDKLLNLPNTGTVSLQCRSTRNLFVTFNGSQTEAQQFFSIVSQIREHTAGS